MVASHIFGLLLVFMTSFSLIVKTGLSYDVSNPSSGSPIPTNYAQRPLSSYETYLGNCAAELYPECGNQIYLSVFLGNQTVINECCFNLVNDLGQRCHEDMTKYVLTSPKFMSNKVSIWERSKKIWNDCKPFSLDTPPTSQ